MNTTLPQKLAEPFQRFFWKSQIKLIRGCPPLCGVIASETFNANQNRSAYMKGLLPVAAQAPRALARHLRNLREHRVTLPRVSFIVTTRCTLKCDKCQAHCADLEGRDAPIEELLQDMQSLFSCVDYIYACTIMGGETFLHPGLDRIIRACADSGKAGHIGMITNGTVIPNEKVLAALREAKAAVKISRYPALQPKVEQLKSVLEENGIPYIHEGGAHWSDTGKLGERKEGSPTERFSLCVLQTCFPYYHGKLHLCGESAVLHSEKLIPDCPEDYIDLRNTTPAAFREQWQKLLKKTSVSACSYCLGQTYQTPKVPVAVQRVPGGKG